MSTNAFAVAVATIVYVWGFLFVGSTTGDTERAAVWPVWVVVNAYRAIRNVISKE
jgi:hypothetical protein